MATNTKKITVANLITDHENTAGPKRRSLRDSWMRLGMDAAIAGDLDLAKVYATAVDQAKQTRTTGSAVEIDWQSVTAERVAALRAAADLIESGSVRPSGTPDDCVFDLDAAVTDADRIAEAARSLAATRLAGSRNVPEFISERVAELGAGWHTASDLARGQVDAPGTGAIGAVYAKMVNDGFTVEGVTAGRNEKGSQAFSVAS